MGGDVDSLAVGGRDRLSLGLDGSEIAATENTPPPLVGLDRSVGDSAMDEDGHQRTVLAR